MEDYSSEQEVMMMLMYSKVAEETILVSHQVLKAGPTRFADRFDEVKERRSMILKFWFSQHLSK